jgi:transposase
VKMGIVLAIPSMSLEHYYVASLYLFPTHTAKKTITRYNTV